MNKWYFMTLFPLQVFYSRFGLYNNPHIYSLLLWGFIRSFTPAVSLKDSSPWPCFTPPVSIVLFIPVSHLLLDSYIWTLFLAFVYCFCFSRVLSSVSFTRSPPLSRYTIYHSLPPSHLSFSPLPSPCLPLLRFSSGSPLIKPLCPLPPCPMSTHTSHTSPPPFLSLISVLLSVSILLHALDQVQ